jgi:hypothetical protein
MRCWQNKKVAWRKSIQREEYLFFLSLFLLSVNWHADRMAGTPAAILDYEVALRMM